MFSPTLSLKKKCRGRDSGSALSGRLATCVVGDSARPDATLIYDPLRFDIFTSFGYPSLFRRRIQVPANHRIDNLVGPSH